MDEGSGSWKRGLKVVGGAEVLFLSPTTRGRELEYVFPVPIQVK